MKSTNELIIEKLKEEFERKEFNPNELSSTADNIWVMMVSAVLFSENLETADFLPYRLKGSIHYAEDQDEILRDNLLAECIPTHIVRLVLRTTSKEGSNDYVDGTDAFILVNVENQTAEFAWEDMWLGDTPKYHGGTVHHATEWVNQLSEPFFIQFKDPFLTSEQRIALNGHDEDFILPPFIAQSQINDEDI